MRLRHMAPLLLLGLPHALLAQSCEVPHPFDRTSAIRGTVAFVPGAGATCDLEASLASDNSTPSGAFAWYSVPDRRSTFRVSFRVDTSALAADSVVDAVEILAVTSRHPAAAPYGNVVLHVGLIGGLADPASAYVAYLAFCGPANSSCSASQSAVGAWPPIADGDRLGFEISLGAGVDGWIRYWQNADFTDPPTFTVENLDNAALLGPEDIALGAFDVSAALAPTGTALRFSDIQTSDDVVFWSDLDE